MPTIFSSCFKVIFRNSILSEEFFFNFCTEKKIFYPVACTFYAILFLSCYSVEANVPQLKRSLNPGIKELLGDRRGKIKRKELGFGMASIYIESFLSTVYFNGHYFFNSSSNLFRTGKIK